MKRHLLFSVAVVLVAALSRLLPHPPNFTPIGALALVGGAYVADRRWSLLLPAAALLLSDAIIGFHSLMPFVYGSFLVIALLGQWVRTHRTVAAFAGATLAGSVLFFIVTNFGVWALDGGLVYPKSFAGLVECYTLAIPFFRNSLMGDVLYTAVLAGIFETAERTIPSLRPVAEIEKR